MNKLSIVLIDIRFKPVNGDLAMPRVSADKIDLILLRK
jgi:hypothetical protein